MLFNGKAGGWSVSPVELCYSGVLINYCCENSLRRQFRDSLQYGATVIHGKQRMNDMILPHFTDILRTSIR